MNSDIRRPLCRFVADFSDLSALRAHEVTIALYFLLRIAVKQSRDYELHDEGFMLQFGNFSFQVVLVNVGLRLNGVAELDSKGVDVRNGGRNSRGLSEEMRRRGLCAGVALWVLMENGERGGFWV